MADSGIEWTEKTLNVITGCTQVSAGCDNCYAKYLVDVRQIKNPDSERYGHPFAEVMLHPQRLQLLEKWKKPRRIFLNSMSDLFHRDVPDDVIDAHFDMMERLDQHVYQALTKRADRLRRYINKRYPNEPCPSHVWLGVSVEDERVKWRADMLRDTNASIRWISAEPLLGSLNPRRAVQNVPGLGS